MTATKPVKVRWYPPEQRGRKSPPAGDTYFAVFGPSASASSADWSVKLELRPREGADIWQEAKLSFVSSDAPIASLHEGYQFYLFEGRWPVAEVLSLRSGVPFNFYL